MATSTFTQLLSSHIGFYTVDSAIKNIPHCTEESNPCQYRTWLSCLKFYPLSHRAPIATAI